MKVITILSLLLLLVSPAFGELTKEDLRTIVREEVTASEKRTREYIDLKIETVNARIDAVNARIDGLEKSLNTKIDALDNRIDELDENLSDRIRDIWFLVLALIGLLAAAIAIPQIFIAYRDRDQKEMQAQIDQLREQIAVLQTPPS